MIGLWTIQKKGDPTINVTNHQTGIFLFFNMSNADYDAETNVRTEKIVIVLGLFE